MGFDFARYAEDARQNAEACERILGRKLTDSEADQICLMVLRMQRYKAEGMPFQCEGKTRSQ